MHPSPSPPLSPSPSIRPQNAGSSQNPNYLLGHHIRSYVLSHHNRSNSACRTILPHRDDFSISMSSQTPGCENKQVDLQKEEGGRGGEGEGRGGDEEGSEWRVGLTILCSESNQLHTQQCCLSGFEAVLVRPPRMHQMCLYALSYMQQM